MLYMAMRHYVFGQSYSRLQGYLLYSRYADERSTWPIPNAPRSAARSLPSAQ